MAIVKFRGDATQIYQLETISVGGTWVAGETATITINGKDATHTVESGLTSVSDVVAGLITAITASLDGEFTELTWVDADPDITATANFAGVPHTISVSESSVSGTISTVTTTSSSGPNQLSAANMSSGSLPIASDTLVLEDTSQNLSYLLTAINGTLLTELQIKASYTGEIGLRNTNIGVTPTYDEYRDRFLVVDATNITIGEGDGNGSSRIQLDCSGQASDIIVRKTARTSVDNYYSLRLTNTAAGSALRVFSSSTVDVSPEEGQAATLDTLDVADDARVRISSGVTIGTIRVRNNATVEIDQVSTLTDITAIELYNSASVYLEGTNGITELNIYDRGTVYDVGGGTIATLRKAGGARYFYETSTLDPGSRIVTTLVIDPGTGNYRTRGVTHTNSVALTRATLAEYPNFDPGFDVNLTIT